MGEKAAGEPFFNGMAWLLAALVLTGFGSVQLFARDSASPFTPALLVHAAVFFSWYVLLILQSSLISRRRHATHIRIGQASVVLALAIAVLGFLTTQTAYHRPGWSIAGLSAAGSTIFPVTDIVNFTICYTLAFLLRRNAAAHKRLMLLSGYVMIDPAVARLVIAARGPEPLILLIEIALFAALFAYDWRRKGRVHWASLFGLALFAGAMALKFTIAETGSYHAFVQALFG